MKIRYASIWSLVGDVDPSILFNRLKIKYPQVKFHNPFDDSYNGVSFRNNIFEGLKIENIIDGKITKIDDQDFSNTSNNIIVHAEIYRFGFICLETTINYENYNEFVINKKPSQLMFENDSNETLSLQASIMNFIIADLICFEEISDLEEEKYNYELDDKIEINKDILKKFGFKIIRLGNSLAPTNDDWSSYKIILDENKKISTEAKDFKEVSDLYKIYKNKTNYIVNDEKIFDKIYKFTKDHSIRNVFVLYQQNAGAGWLSEINEKSRSIYESINNTNDVYWKNLRKQIEIWQLNFLSYNSIFYERLHYIESNLLPSKNLVNDKYNKEYKDYFKKHKNLAISLYNEAKYGLDNLSTPGHTHDEQLLQTETEKGNERILLLSFLAMSIPMLGAILTPSLSVKLKLIAGTIILSLPLLYIYMRKLTTKKGSISNTKNYLTGEINRIEKQLDKTKKIIKQVVDMDDIPEQVKKTIANYAKSGDLRNKKRLDKINKKIKSL